MYYMQHYILSSSSSTGEDLFYSPSCIKSESSTTPAVACAPPKTSGAPGGRAVCIAKPLSNSFPRFSNKPTASPEPRDELLGESSPGGRAVWALLPRLAPLDPASTRRLPTLLSVSPAGDTTPGGRAVAAVMPRYSVFRLLDDTCSPRPLDDPTPKKFATAVCEMGPAPSPLGRNLPKARWEEELPGFC